MWVVNFWKSQIGKKVVMAVTGLIGVGFVVGHMLGNLQMFAGPERMNAYAAFLQGLGELLYLARAVLVLAVVLHVVAAVQLTRLKQQARPVGYVKREPQVSTLASRTIRWGGVLLLVFIVFHILHFTTKDVFAGYSHVDVYGNVVKGFSKPWVSIFYVVSMLALGLHLYHGTWSSMRTIGAVQPSRNPLKRRVALGLAVVVWLGFSSIPLAVLLGFVH
jgi:succinate dehydrogenase / fumarate reductase cytochrome b subunit